MVSGFQVTRGRLVRKIVSMNQKHNFGNFEEHRKQQRENQQKFARGVILFVFPVVAYLSAVIFSYPAAVLNSLRYGTGSPPEQAGITPIGIIIGFLLAYWMSKKIYKSLTSEISPPLEPETTELESDRADYE